MSEKEVSWWKRQGRRFQNGMIVSVVWLVGWLIYAIWAKVYCLEPNQIGDFMAGVAAPVAFGWLVLGYMQQGDEIRETRFEVKRQADALGQEALSRFSSLIRSDIQFTALRLAEHVRKRTTVSGVRDGIKGSRTAYFAGDREAPVRRMVIAIRDHGLDVMPIIRQEPSALAAANRIVDDFEQLIAEVKHVDNDRQALLRFYERSLYGELYNAVCLSLKINKTFQTREFLGDFSQLTV
jgi:hypothetical protein